MSTWPEASSWGLHLTKCQPDLIPQLTKWYQPDLTWGLNLHRVHLTKWQPDPKSDQRLSWPEASSWGYIWPMSAWPEVCTNVNLILEPHPDRYIWPNVNLTLYLNWPNDVNLTWSQVWTCTGYIWPNVNLTWSLTKCQVDLKPHLGGTSHQMSA